MDLLVCASFREIIFTWSPIHSSKNSKNNSNPLNPVSTIKFKPQAPTKYFNPSLPKFKKSQILWLWTQKKKATRIQGSPNAVKNYQNSANTAFSEWCFHHLSKKITIKRTKNHSIFTSKTISFTTAANSKENKNNMKSKRNKIQMNWDMKKKNMLKKDKYFRHDQTWPIFLGMMTHWYFLEQKTVFLR